jgi:hypothetical protein
MDEQEWPLPVRAVCDTPEAVLEAIRTLKEWGEAVIVEHDGERIAAIIPMTTSSFTSGFSPKKRTASTMPR